MLRTHLLPLLLLALATTMPLAAQEIRCDEQPATTLEELLRPDGTFREEIGFRGAVDARGWRITTDSAGRPRFVRSDTMHLDAAAVPDDEYWSAFALPGVNGVVEALLVRDGLVYIGGNFTKAGGEDAGYVAVWNSVNYQFSNLSGGVNGAVYALALDGNDLFVGGSFTRAGSVTVANVARYDLTAGTWHAMGDAAAAGVETPANIAFVRALAVAGDTVHVGGRFTRAGGRTANSIAAYSRSSNQWSALGVGIGGLDATVWALHQIGPQLYVGGRFTTAGGLRSRSIAMWDRSLSQWAPFDSGVNGVVRSFASQGQELYVGGDYNRIQNVPTPNVARMNIVSRRITRLGNPAAAGQNFGIYQPVHAVALGSRGLYVGGLFDRTATNVPVRRIVLWDGSTWRALSSGVAGVGVNAIAVEDERVFAGGDFTGAGERIVNYVAQYGGGNWQGLANAPDNGVNGNVYAVASDGNTLFVGGDFTVAGGVRVSRIARWDGLAWSALAPGGAADLDGAVRALALSGDGLYAAGEFTRAGGAPAAHVARWSFTQSRWTPLGAGTNGAVRALAASGSRLYAAGRFDSAGGSGARNVAVWNGTAWSRLGDGTFDGVNDTVQTLLANGDDLYVGGYFTRAGGAPALRIAQWNEVSRTWAPLDSGVRTRDAAPAAVHALARDGSTLYVGGEFTRAGGLVANYVARWDIASKAWSAIGEEAGRGVCNTVYSILVDRGSLYVGGRFVVAGEIGAWRIARYDAGGWSALGIGLNNGTDNDVYALGSYRNEVYAGGRLSIAGGMRANQIARWDGQSWARLGGDPQLGVDGVVRALAINGDDIYVGGSFIAAGDAASSRIARWNRRTGAWTLLGAGTDGVVYALAATANEVYVAGRFTKAGGVAVGNIARWHVATNTWFPLGPLGDNGIDGDVFALAVDRGKLYVGGSFTTAGDVPVRNLAQWDPAEGTWSPIGAGVNGDVNALAMAADGLYIGGDFTEAGGTLANYIARWEPATDRWVRLAGGPDDMVTAIAVVGRRVYVGGEFLTAGVARASHVGYWDLDAETWRALGDGLSGSTLPAVYAIAADDRSVYVGGSFTRAGSVDASNVAHWDVRKGEWSALGSGVGNAALPSVFAAALDPTGLFVGGNFTRAGDKLSLHFGRWTKLLTGNVSSIDRRDDVSTGRVDASAARLDLAPAPVVDHADIRITLPGAGHATVSIVAADGRILSTLHDGSADAGTRTLQLDARSLASGAYLCVLRHGGRVVTHTFVVLR
ncbi:MAG TPA: T9SS type A sorting domain-containing protein [Candidatus Kapabacteria bacterium]|nr:T9SS type A sorting domain-containing protein [Candidatus Kapabacteria bacterium]